VPYSCHCSDSFVMLPGRWIAKSRSLQLLSKITVRIRLLQDTIKRKHETCTRIPNMATTPGGILLRHIRKLLVGPGARGLPDQQLLERFIDRHDEVAFEALVERHGALVLGVCRRVLGHEQDAEDAFQATFLVLAQKAGSIGKLGSVSSWLYGVANRIAAKARMNAAERRRHEKKAAVLPIAEHPEDVTRLELHSVLDEELQRLPEKYRVPLVLCYLEGKTQDEAARELDWTAGSVKGRLERGRDALRTRLSRRGVTLSAGLLTTMLARKATVPAALLDTTVRTATLMVAGQAASAMISVQVARLAAGATRAMLMTKVKMGAALFLVASMAAAGTGMLAHGPPAEKQRQEEPREFARAADGLEPAKPNETRTDRYGDPLPPGAIARFGTIRFRHEDRVEEFSYSPDGQTLASAAGKVIYLWEPATGKVLRRISGHEDGVMCVAWSPDGKTLVSGSADNTIRLWETTTGKEIRRLEGHQGDSSRFQGGVPSVAFAAAGTRLVSCGRDKTIRLWDTATGKELQQFAGPPLTAWRLVVSPDGNTLAAALSEANQPKGACLWDIATGKEIRRLLQPDPVSGIAFSADGKIAATLGGSQVDKSKPGIVLWDVATGAELRSLQVHNGSVYSAAFSPDGQRLVTGGSWLQLWDLTSGQELGSLEVRSSIPYQTAFCPDGRTVVWRGFEHVLRFWDPTTGKESHAFQGHHGSVSSLAISPDGRLTASTDLYTIRLWDVAGRKELQAIGGHSGFLTCLFFAPDGKTFVSASTDGTFCFWEAATGKELRRIKTPTKARHVEGLALSPDGKTVASWGQDDGPGLQVQGQVHLWDVDTGREVRAWNSNGTRSLAFSPNGKLIAEGSGTDLLVRVRDVATGKEVHSLGKHHGGVTAVVFSPDGKTLVVACMDHSLTLWELATGRERLIVPTGNNIYGFALSPDGRLVATVNHGRSRIATGPPPGKISDAGNEDKDKVRVWDLTTGRAVHQFAGHQGGTTGVAFSPDGKLLISASADTTLLVWDAANLLPAKEAEHELTSAELESFWSDLADPDATKAHQAIWSMVGSPRLSFAFLKDRLRPVVSADPQRVAQLLTDLNSDRPAVRVKAGKQLEEIGESAASALQNVLREERPLEVRRRVEQLLAKLQGDGALRLGRAIEVLEHIHTGETEQLLQSLAQGDAGARLTQEAKASLERLARRPVDGR
jgi:RNA polymerase sigma factor (sigma-70 family)